MDIRNETFPFIDYLRTEGEMADFNPGFVFEFYEAAAANDCADGDPEIVYALGLMLHQLMLDYQTYPQFQELPVEIRAKTLEQAFNIFAKTAQQGVTEAMIMTGWCSLMGFGTEVDQYSARIWFDEAEKHAVDDHPQIMLMRRELERQDAPPAGARPRPN